MLLIALTSLALAVPPGFTLESSAGGCELYLGPTEADGAVPMYADCRWSELSMSALEGTLDKPERANEVFGRVAAAKLVSQRGAVKDVWQLHRMTGLSDREVIMHWTRSTRGDQIRWDWTSSQPTTLLPDNVACERYEGYWAISPLSTGGARVEYYSLYDAGDIPATLVRWFGVSGLKAAVDDLRETVASAKLLR